MRRARFTPSAWVKDGTSDPGGAKRTSMVCTVSQPIQISEGS